MTRPLIDPLTKSIGSTLSLAFALAVAVAPANVRADQVARPQPPGATSESDGRKAWTEEVAHSTSLEVKLETSKGRPWSQGVTQAQMDQAEQLFVEGNQLFDESRFKEAAQKYRDSLALWSHPTIHYNLALALVNLDDPLGAYKHLRETFRYGGEPVEPKLQQEAVRRLKTASRQITELEISCQEVGARVSLDDSEVFTAPIRIQRVLLPGKHTVTVTKPGYLPRDYNLTLVPGEPVKLVARIYTEATLTKTSRPLPFWLPVAVTGLGATMVGTGIILGLESNHKLSQLDSEIKNDPSCAQGCMLSDSQRGLQNDGKSFKTWATVSIVAGSVTTVGGAAWMWLNRKRVSVESPEDYERRMSIAPVVGTNVLGAMATGRF